MQCTVMGRLNGYIKYKLNKLLHFIQICYDWRIINIMYYCIIYSFKYEDLWMTSKNKLKVD